MRQKRHWIGTINAGHMPEGHAVWWDNLQKQPGLRFAACQLEESPKTGNVHLQVYTEWTTSLRLSELRNRASGHWEPRRGSRTEARDYCSHKFYHGEPKGRIDGPWEFGEWRKEGTVTDDLTPKQRALHYMMVQGMTPQDIAFYYPDVYFTHHRAINELYEVTLGVFRDVEEEE